MNADEARAYAIAELGKHRNRNDVIYELCNEHGVDWKTAEELVQDVEIFEARSIARRQSPLLIIIGLGVLAGGFVLTGGSLWALWEILSADAGNPAAWAEGAYYVFGGLVTGISLIAGVIIGFRRLFSSAL